MVKGQRKESLGSWLSDEKCVPQMHEDLGKWFVNYVQQENVEFEVIAFSWRYSEGR